jgi:hypothetical protein
MNYFSGYFLATVTTSPQPDRRRAQLAFFKGDLA